MPTSRPRHLVTETDRVAVALDDAARRWPEAKASRGMLLLRLIEAGHDAVRDEASERRQQRRAAIHRTSGAFTGTYGPGYLEQVRQDWPA
ncbi:MAG: hypothetical protein H0T85_11365 [Geodermatophilaceae bacterium]|nr:hypothetical protein [Geodermatophilaceae bacterium]